MRLYYKKIEKCSECPKMIIKELRLSDKKIPYSKNANFCSATDQELFDEIPNFLSFNGVSRENRSK